MAPNLARAVKLTFSRPLSTKAKSGLKTAGKVGLLATGVGAVGYGAFRGIRGLHRKHQGSQCKGGNMAACQKKARREMTREKKNLKSLKTTSSNAAGMPFDGPSSMSTSRLASAGGSGMMGAPKMMASAPSSGY